MVGAEIETNIFGDASCMRSELVVPRVELGKVNGIAIDMNAGSSGSRFGLLTYKRRKTGNSMEYGTVLDDSATQLDDKSMRHLFNQASQKRSYDPTLASNNCSLKHQRDIFLEQMCQSLESESGLIKCIQNVIAFHPGSCSGITIKESVHSCEEGQTWSAREGLQNAAKASVDIASSGSVNEPNKDTVTQLCRRTFSDVIMSEKFAQLCSLLLENFQGMNANNLLDLSHINSRMKERAYESTPILFQSDIQQIWTKLQRIGNDIIVLAKCLSDETTSSFREQVGSTAHCISEDGKHEFLTQESNMHTKEERTDACAVHEIHACRHCGEKADGRNGLVCDSCEEMYHISCINPPVKEIPIRSWFCANCTAKGIEPSHVNCIACERLNASRSTFDCNGEDKLVYEESPEELEESSNEGGKRFAHCKACRTEVRNDEEYVICGHAFCPHKFYHMRCLTSKQLISYGPCWYCPSCLCRTCFTDQDDDKIVLCDGCDHAYHIYCMDPPRSTIPEGKWFCKRCDAGIQLIRKAKHSYENRQNKSENQGLDGKLQSEEALNKSGGVDMLLNAAKTLNYEENLAATELDTK